MSILDIDETRPDGLDSVSKDPLRQREVRGDVLETLQVEHYLTGEHKFPGLVIPIPALKEPGQLIFKDNLINLGDSIFPVGSSRPYIFSECFGYGSGPGGRTPTGATSGLLSRTLFRSNPSGGAGNINQFEPSQPFSAAKAKIGVVTLTQGQYKANTRIRYFSTVINNSVSLLLAPVVPGINITVSSFNTQNHPWVNPGPSAGLNDEEKTFSILATGDYSLQLINLSSNVGITAISMHLERLS